MKKRLQGLIVGVLVGAMLTSGVVFSKQISETAELFYNNIKIYIDGGEIVPKDANGNVVEPFTMNGTTYLPVRAISNAFGKDVEWDGATQSVYIGKKDLTKPDNYLDRIEKSYFSGREAVYPIIGSIRDIRDNDHTNGIIFTGDAEGKDKPDIVTYPLNSQYSTLKGKAFLPTSLNMKGYSNSNPNSNGTSFNNTANINIYGDGKLLRSIDTMGKADIINFSIDVKGVNELKIEIFTYGSFIYSNVVALTDLALYK